MNTTTMPAPVALPVPAAPQAPCQGEIVDLHELTLRRGTRKVAKAIGVSYRNLLDLRHGTRPLTIDHLYLLCTNYPEFSLVATVERIGQEREAKGVSYRARDVAEGTQPPDDDAD